MKNLLVLILIMSSLSFASTKKEIDDQVRKEFSEEFSKFNLNTIEVQKTQSKERYEKIVKFEKELFDDRNKMLEAVSKEVAKLSFGDEKHNRTQRQVISKIRKNFQKEVKLRRAEFKKKLKEFEDEHKKLQKARWVEFKKRVQVRREELDKDSKKEEKK